MSKITLKAEARSTGKTAAKAVRNQGLVPCIFYGDGNEPIPFAVAPLALRSIIYTPKKFVVDLEIDGISGTRSCILKDASFDPVTDSIVHVDFVSVSDDKMISVEAPVKLLGPSKGVLEGGKLNQSLKRLRIQCFPQNLPEALEVDITNLGQGEKIRIRDLSFENITLLNPSDSLVVGVKAKR